MPRAVVTSERATAADPFSSGRSCGGGPFDRVAQHLKNVFKSRGVVNVHVRGVIVAGRWKVSCKFP